MTQDHPIRTAVGDRRDYLPAAGRDAFLPFYDPFTALLGVTKVHRALIGQAGLAPGQRVLEIGCGTGNLSVRVKRAQPRGGGASAATGGAACTWRTSAPRATAFTDSWPSTW